MNTVKKILIIAILTIVAATAVFTAFNFVGNDNNPKYQLSLAYKYLEEGKYKEAVIAFNKVIEIDDKNIDAHIGLSKAYVKLKKYDEAEKILKKALKIDSKNTDIYKELTEVYELTDRYDKISKLIENLEGIGLDSEADKLRPNMPISDVNSGTYSEPIEVSLNGSGTIYYTDDGSEPTSESAKYSDKIRIDTEGIHRIKAIAVDDKGIASKTAVFEYVIAPEMIKKPTSSLKSGTYASARTVRLENPNGAGKILYSTDGSEPNIEYRNLIKIEKTTIIKAVCVNEQSGAKSEPALWEYEIKTQTSPPTEQKPVQPAQPTQQPVQQETASPFVGVAVQNGTGYTMQKFFTDLFGFNVELSDMRGVGIQIDESAWNKEVSQSEWDSWLAWRKTQYGY